jgi:(R,R)-butanediol dehydrogenase/meso-butanediol dehydrogenase/diacetyl reductase
VVPLADAPGALLDMAAGAPTGIKTLIRCGAGVDGGGRTT